MSVVITATRYNQIRADVDKILGTSDGSLPTFGYGQLTTDEQVTGSRTSIISADTITAEQFRNLYLDLIRIRVHQVGAASVTIEPFVVGNYDINTDSTDKIFESYVIALENLYSDIETDRFLIDDSTQADAVPLFNSVGNPIVSVRPASTGTWNGERTHIFDVEFESEESRRHFFNSGGQIRTSAEVDYAGSQTKTVDWQAAMSAMGNVSFTANSSYSNAGVGLSRPIGNFQLTGSYQAAYRQDIGSTYSNSYYELYALSLDSTTIRIKASFIDGGPNDPTWGIEEDVFGTFTSTVGLLVPNGSAIVNSTETDTVVYNDTITGTTISNL